MARSLPVNSEIGSKQSNLFSTAAQLDQWVENLIQIKALAQVGQDLRKSTEICPPTPNSGGARDQSPPELGDLGGECVGPSRG